MSSVDAAALRAATPMIHVPDVRAAVEWYQALGFALVLTNENHSGGLNFAMLAAGDTRVMFNEGGRESSEFRREVDLYVNVDDVEGCFASLPVGVEVVEELHDTDYGTREFIVRDLNRFWITFGQRREHG